MTNRATWVTVATAGFTAVVVAGAVLLAAGARAGDSPIDLTAGPAPATASPAPERATLIAADERGRIVELSADDGTQVGVLADGAITGGSVGSLTVAGDRRTVFFADHDPLVGLPCDSTVVALGLADGRTTTIGPGFAPALSPDGGRLAYVTTDGDSSGCAYAATVRDLATGAETAWAIDSGWADHYGICSLTWTPGASALAAQLCHGADTVLHRVPLDGAGTIGDATYLGPGDPERSWTAAAPGTGAGTVVVAERCCLSTSPLEPSHRLVILDVDSGEVAGVLGTLPEAIESVAHLGAGPDGDLVLVAFTFTDEGSTERQLLRWTDGVTRLLSRGVVAAAW
ncbi:MAG TPA: hypothetical protein VGR26_01670 [Acidimicrobiales bacterium]|nr:hypothetical protein [Acidimicrobiales bacterium]